jgi:hypothetical protein
MTNLSIITIRKTSFLSIDRTVTEVVTVASSVKLVETPEEDMEDSMEIATGRVDSLLAHVKRNAIKCRSTLQPPHTTIF